jgi:thymidylate kinase
MKQTKHIAIIGIDGSGKSSVARFLAKELSQENEACLIGDHLQLFDKGSLVREPHPFTELIRRYLNGMAKHAKSLKWYKIPKLSELFLRDHLVSIAESRYNPSAVIMDGSPLLNLVAWASMYKDPPLTTQTCGYAIKVLMGMEIPSSYQDPLFDELPELLRIKRLKINKMNLPDVCLFLDVSPQEACMRIESRGEKRQVHETGDSLDRLRSAYLKVMDSIEDSNQVKIHVIDANRDLSTVLDSALSCAGNPDAKGN